MSSRFDAALAALLAGPRAADHAFIAGGASFGDVYRLAAWLRTATKEAPDEPLCLASEDKVLVAAALLAALSGGPALLLPYGLSGKALAALAQAIFRGQDSELHGISTLSLAAPANLPQGLRCLRPPSLDELPAQDDGPAPVLAPSSRIMLKIFTGGTTGAPQIWCKSTENILGEGLYLAERFQVTPRDRIVATVPPFHIYGLLYAIVLPLVAGATVCDVAPSFPGEIEETVRRLDASIFVSVPAHYRAIRERRITGGVLRLAFSSAGMLDVEDNLAFTRQNGAGVVEVYGSTETGGIATRNRFQGESVFQPFSMVSWRIREQRLAVRSPFLSAELPCDENGYFLTGDRAKAAGSQGFILQGRADSVTKVGGKRVDMDTIHALVSRVPGVEDCVVLALPEESGREHCVGVLVQGDGVDSTLIRAALAGSLEPYALPRIVKTGVRIPLKDNGKPDRDAIIRILQE